ncbi:hypothetical protein ACB094_09G071800 [Castanea mollissima]
MTHSCLKYEWALLIFFHGILLLCMSSSLISATVSAFANEADRLALLDFKNRITQDPLQIMSSWNDSIHFCNWLGVTCGPSSKRVMVLNLSTKKLSGSMPPSIGNLTHLTGINLENNSFYGEIPQEVGRLHRLWHLSLTYNSFGGKLPTNMSYCSQLRELTVGHNELVGQIPDHLSSLSKLVYLRLDGNNLTGNIPAWIGNFSSLYALSLSENNFQGSIPNELGYLPGLKYLQLSVNNLSGTIPPLIYNISSIYFFSVTENRLHGSLPPDIGLTLPNLQIFYCGINNFTGPIPASLSNASQLQGLALGNNGLIGPVPQNLASLQGLVGVYFAYNRLGYGKDDDLHFVNFLANCTSLKVLDLGYNYFGGVLPRSIANLSTQLQFLYFDGNMIRGGIPIGIENLVNLESLVLSLNFLGGTLPDGLGKLQKLKHLYLDNNTFSGPIPSSLGNLSMLIMFSMEKNKLEGKIPPSLGNCQNLLFLNISSNNLTDTIPKQVIGLSSLSISLDMSHNFLIGALPFEVGNLIHLAWLDISNNRLSGKIPTTLETCLSLEHLYLEGNSFQDAIPQSLKMLRGLEQIDLSRNNFSGNIPKFLDELASLKYLNISYNDLEGEVPSEGIFANASQISIFKNSKLCGGVQELHLPTCTKKNPHSSTKLLALKIVIPFTSMEIELYSRLNIAVDVAYALEYLHHNCETPIVHCDLKPSNILLDEDMVAHVGDFGLVKFLFEESNNLSKTQILSVGLKGSIGYIPPEYGMGGQVSTLGDVYSYGILLLELFIGKRPIDEMFKDGMNIYNFTAMALPEHVMDILDPLMFFGEEDEDVNDDKHKDDIEERAIIEDQHVNVSRKIKDCLISVFRIGLSGSTISQDERVPMNVVVNEMNAIRDTFLKYKMRKQKKKELG